MKAVMSKDVRKMIQTPEGRKKLRDATRQLAEKNSEDSVVIEVDNKKQLNLDRGEACLLQANDSKALKNTISQ